MAVDRSLNTAELTALLLESVFYGVFLVFFCILLIILFFEKNHTVPKKRYIIPISTLMMLLATSHLIIDFLRVLCAFVPQDPIETADKFFKKLSHPYAVLNWTLYGLQTILGDSVLVWRCYIFCDKKWWIVIPGALLICFNTANLVIVSRAETLAVGSAFIDMTRPWVVSWISVSAALQLLYSSVIVVQIYRKFYEGGHHVNYVLKAIVESCGLYTFFALALLITFEGASDADWVIIDLISPIVGISFCLIIIQLHMHFRGGHSTEASISTLAVRTNVSGAWTNSPPDANIGIEKIQTWSPGKDLRKFGSFSSNTFSN